MRIDVTITHAELLNLIAQHVQDAVGRHIDTSSIRLYVRSKNNYRMKTWEDAELRVTNAMKEEKEPIAPDTELKAEVSQNG